MASRDRLFYRGRYPLPTNGTRESCLGACGHLPCSGSCRHYPSTGIGEYLELNMAGESSAMSRQMSGELSLDRFKPDRGLLTLARINGLTSEPRDDIRLLLARFDEVFNQSHNPASERLKPSASSVEAASSGHCAHESLPKAPSEIRPRVHTPNIASSLRTVYEGHMSNDHFDEGESISSSRHSAGPSTDSQSVRDTSCSRISASTATLERSLNASSTFSDGTSMTSRDGLFSPHLQELKGSEPSEEGSDDGDDWSVRSLADSCDNPCGLRYVGMRPSTLDGYQLPCEFHGLGGCSAVFGHGEEDAWRHHIRSFHLQYNMPEEMTCWYCDAVFEDFDTRMDHICEHHKEDCLVTRHFRPDMRLIEHVAEQGLLDQHVYESALAVMTEWDAYMDQWKYLCRHSLEHHASKVFGLKDILPMATFPESQARLESTKDFMFEIISMNFKNLIIKNVVDGARQRAGGPGAEQGQLSATSVGLQEASGRGGTAIRQPDGPGRGEDGDDSRKRKAPSKARERTAARLNFACPYFKHDNVAYKQCSKIQNTVLKISEHINKVHLKLSNFQCRDCDTIFNSQLDLEQHHEGVSTTCTKTSVRNQIKSILHGQPGKERWNAIYKVLFPFDRTPPSPYAQSYHIPTPTMNLFTTHLRRNFERREILRELHDSMIEDIRDALDKALRGVAPVENESVALEQHFDQGFTDEESSTTGPSHSIENAPDWEPMEFLTYGNFRNYVPSPRHVKAMRRDTGPIHSSNDQPLSPSAILPSTTRDAGEMVSLDLQAGGDWDVPWPNESFADAHQFIDTNGQVLQFNEDLSWANEIDSGFCGSNDTAAALEVPYGCKGDKERNGKTHQEEIDCSDDTLSPLYCLPDPQPEIE